MLHRKFLNASQIVDLYTKYLETFNAHIAATRAGVSYNNALKLIREIHALKAGEVISRQRNRDELMKAFAIIARNEGPSNLIPTPPPVTTETAEQKVDRLFEELKQALAELATQLVTQKNQELVDAARNSNFVGFLKSRGFGK